MWLLAASLGLVAGCYDYHPLTAPSPDQGSYVAATLTETGSVDLARYLGPDVFVVRGRYLGTGEAGVIVSVTCLRPWHSRCSGAVIRSWREAATSGKQ